MVELGASLQTFTTLCPTEVTQLIWPAAVAHIKFAHCLLLNPILKKHFCSLAFNPM